MKKRKKAQNNAQVQEICPGIKKEDVILSFTYNLHPSEPSVRCRGVIVVDKNDLIIFRDGREVDRIKLSDVASIKIEIGVGSCVAQY